MNKRYSISQRILALTMSLLLILGLLPRVTFNASAAGTDVALEDAVKAADPSTMDNWKKYFPDNSTEFAGGVWTDKSVFASAQDYVAAGGDSRVTLANSSNFLVALSAIASNKQVVGFSSVPTDTMLVLDLSNSMDNSGSVPGMIEAANSTIHTLMQDNPYNRVGVVLYSGNTSTYYDATKSSAKVVLPLDHYTGVTYGNTTRYLSVSGNSDTTVSVTSGVKNSAGQTVSGSKNTNGSTYIQNGLYQAWEEFEGVTDITVNDPGSVMHGVRRTPILVLMSDGAPTIATESYYNVATSDTGNGGSTGNRITFLTQLTAAYVKSQIETKYGTAAKFYTLGLGTGNSADATAVLYPSTSNSTITDYWEDFLAGTAGSNVSISTGGNNYWTLYRHGAITKMNYVDRYWYASNSADMIEAFQNILKEIQLASAYSATLVESGNYDMDGYISFEDEIGELMQVFSIKGIKLGNSLFTGAEMAKSINEGNLGTRYEPTDYGNEFVATVRERIGIDTSTAQALIGYAVDAGQLSYTSDSQYSNYIGWYADADGNYLGFWEEADGYGPVEGMDAVYINKSYGYLGEAGSADMMHVVVMLRTEIATSHQDVVFEIPASLIPMVTYDVTVAGNTIVSATKLESNVGSVSPIQLLYEVGLREDINSVNLEQKVQEYLATYPDGHIHKNDDGTYSFYTNMWGNQGQDPAYSEALLPYVAESHFQPSLENERYYYTDAADIYVASGSGYTRYTGGSAPSGTGYYYQRTIVSSDASGKASVTYKYVPISPLTLQNANNLMTTENGWAIKGGTPYVETSRFEEQKTENKTQTLPHSDYPMVVHSASGYHVYAVLGNNGKLTLAPLSGIRLSKTVSQGSPKENAPQSFEFTVTLDKAIAEADLDLVDTDGKAWTGSYQIVTGTDSTTITLWLKDGETVLIAGMPAGTGYTVHETQSIYYNSNQTDDTVTGKVPENGMAEAAFTNAPRKESTLTITKTVNHPFQESPAQLREIDFTVTVDLGAAAANLPFLLADGTTVTADANGMLTLTLNNESSVTITGLLEDTPFVAQEINIPKGFALNTQDSVNLGTSVDLVPGANYVRVVNDYKADPPISPEITLTGTKTVEGNYTGDESFTFVVEKYVGESQEHPTGYVTMGTGSAVDGASYTIQLKDTYSTVGTHYYRIVELTGDSKGMAYDASQGLFTVVVTDDDLDGTLEYTVQGLANVQVNGDTVTKNFVNTYSTTSTYVDLFINKHLTNDTGVEIPMDTFRFGLYAQGETTPAYTVTTNANGGAIIRIPLDTAGTYSYVLKEIPGDMVGMRYDETEVAVTIVVEDVDSVLTATVTTNQEPSNADQNTTATFRNIYDLTDTSVVLNGDKDLIRAYNDTQVKLEGGEYAFELWTANTDFTPNTKLATVQNGVDGGFTFADLAALRYSSIGPRYYIIREVPGTDSAVTYDSHDVYVLVNVVAEGTDLKATAYYRDQGASTGTTLAKFTNTYTVTGNAETTIRGSKGLTVLQGSRSLRSGEFTFQLKDASGTVIDTATNTAGGAFTFNSITYTPADIGKTFTYTVSEVKGDKEYFTYDAAVFTVTVEVRDKGDGTMEAVQTVSGGNGIRFDNKYTAKATSTSFSGTKSLTGRAMKAGEFTFTLYATDANFSKKGTVVDTATNGADGKFTLYTGSYTKVGHYYYILSENIPENRQGVAYDANEYYVTVQVVDSGNGQLEVLKSVYKPGVQVTDGPITFSNIYTANPAKLDLVGHKTYDKELKGGDFRFILKDAEGKTLQTKTNNVDGTILFDQILLDKTGTYTFTVNEDKSSKPAFIQFDDTVYTVVVTVSDDGRGDLYVSDITYTDSESNPKASVDFVNDYQVIYEADVVIEGTKYYIGDDLTAGRFSFQLKDETGKVLQTVTNTVSSVDAGSFAFEAIKFTPDMVGNTYTYYVSEVIPEDAVKQEDGDYLKDGVFYDPAVFTVTVTLTDNEEGGMTVTKKVNGVENGQINFTNSYSVVEGGDVTITGIKTLLGKTLQAGMFTFELYEADKDFQPTSEQPISTANLADGTFAFDTITYSSTDAGKTFYYIVKEQVPADAVKQDDGTYVKNGIVYDNTVYKVTVAVEDNDKGGVNETVTITGGGTANTILFNNTYRVDDQKQIAIEGTKVYENGTLQAGQFSFGMFVNDERVGDLVTNDANGKFSFPAVTYTAADIGKTFTYEIREVAGDKSYIVYSQAVFTVTVQVEDNGDGTLKLTKLVNGNPDGQVKFINTYVNNGTATLTLEGIKTYLNSVTNQPITVEPNQFQFQLRDENKNLLQTVRNLSGGVIKFEAIAYTAADIGKEFVYYITEVRTSKTYITYDTTEYKVTVKVEDNGDGTLKLTKTVEGGADETIRFANTYVNNGTGEVTLQGTKTYVDGRTGEALAIAADTFRFALTGDKNVNQTVAAGTDGTFAFAPIPFTAADIGETFTFTVSEVAGDQSYIRYDSKVYTVTVAVEDDRQGGLKFTTTYKNSGAEAQTLAFENTYVNEGTGEVIVEGLKTYTKPLAGNEFSFILSQVEKDSIVKLQEVKNGAQGTIAFQKLTYTTADIGKTYTYQVEEFIPTLAVRNRDNTYTLDGVTYDPDIYTFTVTVEDDYQGGLRITKQMASQTVTGNIQVEFNNTYDIVGTGELELTGTKHLLGGKQLEDGVFSFLLLDCDGKEIDRGENTGNSFTLTATYDKHDISAQPIVYTVVEQVPTNAQYDDATGTYTLDGVTYDPKVYTVEVMVTDNGRGGIDVAYTLKDAQALTFTNRYTADPVEVTVTIQKTVVNKTPAILSPEGFRFTVSGESIQSQTVVSNEQGLTGFRLVFDHEDIDRSYTFTVKEENTGIEGVTYDTTVHTVVVAVTQNLDGTLAVTVNGEATNTASLSFTNEYTKSTQPPMGDDFQPVLLVVALVASAAGLLVLVRLGKRKKTN